MTCRGVRALLFLAVGGLSACGRETAPNIVLVSVDTLRADAVGAYGGPVPTPTLDGLAAEGILFENAFAPSAETAPSHATLFTGQEVLRHRVTQNGVALPDELATLAQALRAEGYHTGGFVSSFVLDSRFGWSRGFDAYDAEFPASGSSFKPEQIAEPGFWDEYEVGGFDRPGRITTARARAWLETAREPFFLFVHYFDPHSPYEPDPAYVKKVSPAALDLGGRDVPGLSARQLARIVRLYHAEVLYVDDVLGALLEGLGRRGLRERSLVVVTADHGEGLGQHGWLAHQVHLYDEQIRVPLLFSWPAGLPAGRRVVAPVGLVDLFPTLLDLVGVPAPPGLDGTALQPLGAPSPRPEPLYLYRRFYASPYFGHRGEKVGIRTARWKYLRASAGEPELFDLEADPGELRNRAPARPEVVARLSGQLDRFLAQAPAPGAAAALDAETRRALEALGYAEGPSPVERPD